VGDIAPHISLTNLNIIIIKKKIHVTKYSILKCNFLDFWGRAKLLQPPLICAYDSGYSHELYDVDGAGARTTCNTCSFKMCIINIHVLRIMIAYIGRPRYLTFIFEYVWSLISKHRLR
jgi:hypothetical protein